MNQTRTWNYDAASQRLTSMALPESGATSYSYTAADGMLDTKTDARGTGRSMSTTYPNGHFDGAAPTFKRYEYEYDTMGRPSKMKEERFDQNGNRYWADLVAAAVKYGPRGEITEFNGEVRQYNVMGQLTGIGSYMCGGWACYGQPPVPAIEYRYSATQNNGQSRRRRIMRRARRWCISTMD